MLESSESLIKHRFLCLVFDSVGLGKKRGCTENLHSQQVFWSCWFFLVFRDHTLRTRTLAAKLFFSLEACEWGLLRGATLYEVWVN
jgi:hypothetical protein